MHLSLSLNYIRQKYKITNTEHQCLEKEPTAAKTKFSLDCPEGIHLSEIIPSSFNGDPIQNS